MAGKALNIKVCNPLKLHSSLTGKYNAICHYLYNFPLKHIPLKVHNCNKPVQKITISFFLFMLSRIDALAYVPVSSANDNSNKVWIWLLSIIIFDIIILIIYIHRKNQRTLKPGNDQSSITFLESFGFRKPGRNAILLFGNVQLFDAEGKDLSPKLSPLLKELFLMIIFFSSDESEGVPVNKVIDNFWNGMPGKNARNNLAVNIGKMKSILEKAYGNFICNEKGYLKFQFDTNLIYCDLFRVNAILDKTKIPGEDEITELIRIVQQGKLLSEYNYEWLDNFKSNIANKLIDAFLEYGSTISYEHKAELLIKIADTVFIIDAVNEDAMVMKCKSLLALKKHSLCKETYSKFIADYKAIYDTDYGIPFKTIIE